jgi:hypothetical protein
MLGQMAGNGYRLAEGQRNLLGVFRGRPAKINECLRRRRNQELNFLNAAARGYQAFGKRLLAAGI